MESVFAMEALVRQTVEDHHSHTGEHQSHTGEHQSHAEEAGGYCTSNACLRNWKIAFAVILFLEGVLFGYFPLILRRFACLSTVRFRKFMSLINAGGGGIFLATGLLHILPEAFEFFEHSGEAHGVETHANESGTNNQETPTPDPHGEESHGFPIVTVIVLSTFLVFLLLERVVFAHSHSALTKKHDDEERTDIEDGQQNDSSTDSSGNGIRSAAFAGAALSTLGVAAHSILESVAMGSTSKWSIMLNTFIAISAHRWATSMALGSRYARAELKSGAYSALIILFSLVAPLGIAIGVGVGETSPTVQGVVFALSAGTFLYIGGFETPSMEFVERTDNRIAKFFVFAGGAALIVAITAILSATGVH